MLTQWPVPLFPSVFVGPRQGSQHNYGSYLRYFSIPLAWHILLSLSEGNLSLVSSSYLGSTKLGLGLCAEVSHGDKSILNRDLNALSLKTAFVLGLCSAKWVWVLCTLSWCFIPSLWLKYQRWASFQPSSSSQAEWEELLPLCPVRALCAHLPQTWTIRKSHS